MITYGPGFTGYNGGENKGNPIYEIHWRGDTAVFGQPNDGFATYTGSTWSVQSNEYTQGDPNTPTAQGYQWKTFGFPVSGESFYVDPFYLDTVTYHDGSTKKATIYVSLTDVNEDEGDFSTGSPASYIIPAQTIATGNPPNTGSDITLWYTGYLNWNARGCSTTNGCLSGASWYAKDFT